MTSTSSCTIDAPGRSREILRGLPVELAERLRSPHGVDQVERGVDALRRALQRSDVEHIADRDFDIPDPGAPCDSPGVANHDADRMPLFQEAGDEPPPDVSSRAGDENAHSVSLFRQRAGETRTGSPHLSAENQASPK